MGGFKNSFFLDELFADLFFSNYSGFDFGRLTIENDFQKNKIKKC